MRSTLRAETVRSTQRHVAALTVYLLLQPLVLVLLGAGTAAVGPTHGHATNNASVPAHEHWYDTDGQPTTNTANCAGNHHDHRLIGAQDALVVCVPGQDIAGHSVVTAAVPALSDTSHGEAPIEARVEQEAAVRRADPPAASQFRPPKASL